MFLTDPKCIKRIMVYDETLPVSRHWLVFGTNIQQRPRPKHRRVQNPVPARLLSKIPKTKNVKPQM
jgi:hypothetical protein